MSKYIPVFDLATRKTILVKRPKDAESLPLKKKIKDDTFVLERTEHPVMKNKILFTVKKYKNSNLMIKKQFTSYESALRFYKKLMRQKQK